MLFFLVFIVALIFGFIKGWKDISQSKGIFGRILKPQYLVWLNQDQATARGVKLLLCVFCAYICFAAVIVQICIWIKKFMDS